MKVQTYALKEHYHLQGGELTAYIGEMPFDFHVEGWKRPAVIVVGGGGYAMVSKREVEPVVFQFLAKGFHVFSLCYETAPAVRYPEELLELACAVDFIRKNAEAFTVNPDEIFAVAYAQEGKIKKISAATYIITPYNVDIIGDLIDELESSGLYF